MAKPMRPIPKQITYIEIIIFIIISVVVYVLTLTGFRFDLRLLAQGEPANITVSTKNELLPLPTGFYHAFAQGGEESVDMLAPVVPAIQALHPAYIRIDHIFDHYGVVQKNGGILSFDFGQLDSIVNTILSTGATPVFSLSYVPAVIAKDGVITNPPTNWNDWTDVVRKTIEHYSGKSGKNLTGVYYEVWNEPDLEQFGKWKTYGDKNYLTLYGASAQAANAAQNVNKFYFGGPATTGLYKDWITSLIKSGYRIDFLSWHTYNGDPKQFASDHQNLSEWLKGYPEFSQIPTLITEYGFTGDKDERYATTYASSYTAAVIRKLLDSPPTALFTFELKDGPGAGSTGWGLLPHESIGGNPKPRYQLFPMLNDMTGTRLAVMGEGTWVTAMASVREHVIRVLLINFYPDGAHSENVPVTFTDLDKGEYIYREHQLLGHDATFQKSITESTWQTTVFMPSQSVTELTLTKQ